MDAADETQTDSMLLEYTDVVRIDQLSRKINGLIVSYCILKPIFYFLTLFLNSSSRFLSKLNVSSIFWFRKIL